MKKRTLFLVAQLIIAVIAVCSLLANDLIDVVYTWVDGSDPKWRELFAEYAQKEGNTVASGALAKRRFTDHEELRYSLRSIYQYAPWVHHIYIVTFGQRPSWLKEHSKISIVDHRDIFSHPEHLPTFNSMAIECHLHRIPHLQEHYLYFNDDVFLGAPTSPHDFFSSPDTMNIFLSKRKLPSGAPMPGEEGFFAASKNTGALLDEVFSPTVRYMHAHTPYPTLKSFVCSLERRFPEIFSTVSSHRFRSLADYTITNGLIPYTALHTGRGNQIPDQWTTVNFGSAPDCDAKVLKKILQEHPRFFCIQDGADDDHPLSLFLLASFFQEYFPQPAPWERDEEMRQNND